MKLSKITSLVVLASTLAVGGAHAQFLAGWDFQDTTGLGTSTTLNPNLVNGSNNAVLDRGDFTAFNGLGTGNSSISGFNSFFADNGFQGGVAGDNTTGTKSLGADADGDAFTITFDASSASSLDLYLTTGVQNTGDFGTNVSGSFYNQVFTVTLDNGTSTTTLDLGNHFGASYGADVAADISFLDGASIATLTFTANGNTPSQLVAIDNIGLSGVGSISVVPEPSAFAALAGVLVLGFAAVRRRR